MRTRHWLGLGLFAILLLAIPLLILCLGRSDADSVNARTIARLQLGMTQGEVERVLGRPADSDAVITKDESGQVKEYMAKQWVGLGGRDVRVAFNDAGKTFTIVEGVPPRPGILDRLHEWIGF
jgi:hypothetical protein